MEKNKLHPDVPNWAALVYALLAVVSVPWTIYLAVELPENHLSSHWDAAWVGFDIGLLFMLLATAWLARKQSRLLVIPATITATMLVIDAWFDTVTAHRGLQLNQSLMLAFFAELPLALISYRIAYKMLYRQAHQ
jgi:hypothetical protein